MKKRSLVTYERTEHTGHESARWARDTDQPADGHDQATRKLHQQGFSAHVGRSR